MHKIYFRRSDFFLKLLLFGLPCVTILIILGVECRFHGSSATTMLKYPVLEFAVAAPIQSILRLSSTIGLFERYLITGKIDRFVSFASKKAYTSTKPFKPTITACVGLRLP